ncbi:MAG: DUF2087 domain-containing protein [Anaerolineales bacterium]
MSTQDPILEFAKAMASVERLRLIGALVRGPATQAEIAGQVHLPVREVHDHLAFLVSAGVVREEGGRYRVDEKSIESLVRRQFEGKRAEPESVKGEAEDVRKILRAYLKSDGALAQLPVDAKKLRVILGFLVEAFAFDAVYTEKEVNTILRRFHVDTAALRRYLVDEGFMAREGDGSKYWRVKREAA